MSSKAERDRIKESRRWIWWALIVALAIQIFYESIKGCSSSWPAWGKTTVNVLGDIMPNIVASAAVALVIGWWISEYPREKYLHADQSARKVIREMRLLGAIGADDAQKIMTGVVKAMSKLYFDAASPNVEPSDTQTRNDAQCGTCLAQSCMTKGRCDRCDDISDAWFEERNQPSITQT